MILGMSKAARPRSCLDSLFVINNNQGFPMDTQKASSTEVIWRKEETSSSSFLENFPDLC